MDSDTIAILALFAFMAGFAIFFFFVVYKVVSFASRRGSPVTSVRTPLTKEQLNTVIRLTPQEQTSMRRGVWAATVITVVIFGFFSAEKAWEYYRFVLVGERVQATVIEIQKHRSSGRHHRTTYQYTLEAVVDGVVVTDTYSVGSISTHDEGDVVEAYASSDGALAVAGYEQMDPVWISGFLALLIGIQVALAKQRARIALGEMKVANLPKEMRRRKLQELGMLGDSMGMAGSDLVPSQTTSDGKPAYSIGGSRLPSPSTSRVEGDDGSNYRP